MRAPAIAGLALACAAMFLSGCATPTKLAFAKDPNTPPKANDRIYLMTATFHNAYRTSHRVTLFVVNVEKPDAKNKADRLNFTIDDGAKSESDSTAVGNSYYLSLKLDPGNYVIQGLTAQSAAFPTRTWFFAPLHSDLAVAGPGVFYLGHIEATVRERQGDEFKAGPSIPLIDQAVGGASGGTFDIEISDQWDTEKSRFFAKFPALKSVVVTKAILPPFDRAKAQEWWEKH
jgi:hypothetical protein